MHSQESISRAVSRPGRQCVERKRTFRALFSIGGSSFSSNIWRTISAPPMNSPDTYSCGMVGLQACTWYLSSKLFHFFLSGLRQPKAMYTHPWSIGWAILDCYCIHLWTTETLFLSSSSCMVVTLAIESSYTICSSHREYNQCGIPWFGLLYWYCFLAMITGYTRWYPLLSTKTWSSINIPDFWFGSTL